MMAQPYITFVTTVYNRIESVRLHLESLRLQRKAPPFSLIMVDDGSTEDTRGLFQEYAKDGWAFHQFPHGDPLLGVRARNEGMRRVSPETTHIWLTDGDIVFNKYAVMHAYRHLAERPDVIYGGRYDWMPRMKVTCEDLQYNWSDFVCCQLQKLPMNSPMGGRGKSPEGYCFDPRTHWESCYTEYVAGGQLLGSNAIIPVQAFKDSGGYDEDMPPACNAGDCEFGKQLGYLGYKISLCECIRGYHLYHYRDMLALTLGVRRGIVYMHEKYPNLIELDYKRHLPKLPPGVTDEWSHLDGSQD